MTIGLGGGRTIQYLIEFINMGNLDQGSSSPGYLGPHFFQLRFHVAERFRDYLNSNGTDGTVTVIDRP